MDKPHIVICIGSSCFARGNERNVAIAEEYLTGNGLADDVNVDLAGSLCSGRCADGPIVVINGEVFSHVDGGVMIDLLRRYLPTPSPLPAASANERR